MGELFSTMTSDLQTNPSLSPPPEQQVIASARLNVHLCGRVCVFKQAGCVLVGVCSVATNRRSCLPQYSVPVLIHSVSVQPAGCAARGRTLMWLQQKGLEEGQEEVSWLQEAGGGGSKRVPMTSHRSCEDVTHWPLFIHAQNKYTSCIYLVLLLRKIN